MKSSRRRSDGERCSRSCQGQTSTPLQPIVSVSPNTRSTNPRTSPLRRSSDMTNVLQLCSFVPKRAKRRAVSVENGKGMDMSFGAGDQIGGALQRCSAGVVVHMRCFASLQPPRISADTGIKDLEGSESQEACLYGKSSSQARQ